MTLLVGYPESSGELISLSLSILFHHGSPCSSVTWGFTTGPLVAAVLRRRLTPSSSPPSPYRNQTPVAKNITNHLTRWEVHNYYEGKVTCIIMHEEYYDMNIFCAWTHAHFIITECCATWTRVGTLLYVTADVFTLHVYFLILNSHTSKL
jgi:hypothetical protein